ERGWFVPNSTCRVDPVSESSSMRRSAGEIPPASPGFLHQRQANAEAGAGQRTFHELDRPVQPLHDLVADMQAQAEPATRWRFVRAGANEFLEDGFAQMHRDSRTIVGNFHDMKSVFAA